MHGLRLFSDVSARGNAAPSLLHGYASHTETDHAASRLLPLILHPDEKSGTTHNCSKIHEGNADNNSYFHDADIVSYEAQPDASQYPEYIHKILHPTSVSSTGTIPNSYFMLISPRIIITERLFYLALDKREHSLLLTNFYFLSCFFCNTLFFINFEKRKINQIYYRKHQKSKNYVTPV